MAEDSFVQMLLQAAQGSIEDERDVQLARDAGRWAVTEGGWKLHLHNGFFVPGTTLQRWVLVNRPDNLLTIRVRAAGRKNWVLHDERVVADLGHGLDLLAGEYLIPGRLCPIGRSAVEHALARR